MNEGFDLNKLLQLLSPGLAGMGMNEGNAPLDMMGLLPMLMGRMSGNQQRASPTAQPGASVPPAMTNNPPQQAGAGSPQPQMNPMLLMQLMQQLSPQGQYGGMNQGMNPGMNPMQQMPQYGMNQGMPTMQRKRGLFGGL